MLAALATACSASSARDPHLEYGSIDDVRQILASGGATSLALDCANVRYATGEVIRSVACTTTLPAASLTSLVETLSLTTGPAFNAGMRDACESRSGLRSADPGVEVLVGKNRRVQNGVGRIELHVVRASGTACVEITYPWSE